MTIRSALIQVLVASLAIPPAMAQPQHTDPDRWRAFAEQLPPNALVTVHLTSGGRIEGQVVEITTDTLQVNPKTASGIPGYVQVIPFSSIQSIDQKEGMSTGAKVAIWTVVAVAAGWLIGGIWVAVATSHRSGQPVGR